MGRLRSPWGRAALLWTLLALVAGVVLAVQAVARLYDAQQACFFTPVPCPDGHDPAVAQLTFAFFGVPLAWLVGIGLLTLAWTTRRRRDPTAGRDSSAP